MTKVALAFTPDHRARGSVRFDQFIAWAEPFGGAGLNDWHDHPYKQDDPWFQYSPRLIPHSHGSSRSWFIKHERLNRHNIFTKPRDGTPPKVLLPSAVIAPGRYLSFAKAYLNVSMALLGTRSIPKAAVRALIALEKALRDLNAGSNEPARLSLLAFRRAAASVNASKSLSPSKKYDVGKALEGLAAHLQSGQRMGTFRGRTVGFRLLETSFPFRSPIEAPPRFGKLARTAGAGRSGGKPRLTGEHVAAVGLAYRRARVDTGQTSQQTFVASLLGMTLTTVSMRASELQLLARDCLFRDKDGAKRLRLRIARPKIGTHQILPIPRRLEDLALEMFGDVLLHSKEASEAFAFYVEQFPQDFAAIDRLFIPDRIAPLLASEYLTREQTWKVLQSEPSDRNIFTRQFEDLRSELFVDSPGDVYHACAKCSGSVVRIADVVAASAAVGYKVRVPKDARLDQYVRSTFAVERLACKNPVARSAIQALFARTAQRSALHVHRDELCQALLKDFKKSRFPHWPYATKERSLRIDKALAVWFRCNVDAHVARGTQQRCWWRPTLLSMQDFNLWISGGGARPPRLFELFDVRLSNGSWPSISVHMTRKYHHTEALLAGASPAFIDELAGRESGWQSTHYDERTPRQVLTHSIETFDPDEDYEVIGPVADRAPPRTKVVERRVFFFENAAPKQVTEIGGCSTDWSLTPCWMFGDCVRCGSHVWRKGDRKRLPRIHEILAEARRAVPVGKRKLKANPRLKTIAMLLKQQQQTIARCEEILRVEADPSISIGTLVTFPMAEGAMTTADLAEFLRAQPIDRTEGSVRRQSPPEARV